MLRLSDSIPLEVFGRYILLKQSFVELVPRCGLRSPYMSKQYVKMADRYVALQRGLPLILELAQAV
jgi:hypothetical protein